MLRTSVLLSGLAKQWTSLVALLLLIAVTNPQLKAQEEAAAPAEAMEGLSPEQQKMIEEFSKINPIDGPTTVDVGSIAQVAVPEGYQYLNATDAQKLLTLYGNPPNSSVQGLLQPKQSDDPAKDWFLVFMFDDIGYIKDADKESIDADEILASFRNNIEASNEQRRAMGGSELRQIDWSDTPFYDSQTNNLTWGLRLKFDEGDSINYDIRMLGRSGVMSATLVGSPEHYQATIPAVKQLLAGYSFKDGAKYADWKPGDKIAAVGLAGLIGGGALAVAAKSGLLAKLGLLIAKGGKAVILVVIAVFAGLFSIVKKLFGVRSTAQNDTYQ